MYILYGGGYSRAIGPQMVLEEGGLDYEQHQVDLQSGEHRTPEFLAINPAGYVPALVTPEGDVLHEAAAIMLYLADRHHLTDLAPAVDDPARGVFLSKLFYFTNDIQPALKRFYYAHRYAQGEDEIARTRQTARDMASERWGVLDRYLQDNGPYHLGERFSLADLHMALWAAYGFEGMDEILDAFPGVRRCYDLAVARPKSGPLINGMRDEVTALRASRKSS